VKTEQGWEVRFDVETYDPRRELVIDPVLTYGTYFGGADDEFGAGIAVDGKGNIVVTGHTYSLDFPISSGAFQTQRAAPDPDQSNAFDAFVMKLSADGSKLLYSTFIGGEYGDNVKALAVDGDGNAYITGWTCSARFPLKNPLQGPASVYTCNGFLSKLNPTGSDLVFSTYFGTYSQSTMVEITGIAVDATRKITLVGSTTATDFPITANAIQPVFNMDPNEDPGWQQADGFVSKISADGRSLIFSTYLGGIDREENLKVATDFAGSHIYVTGETRSQGFPVLNAAQPTLAYSGTTSYTYADAFITKLKGDGSAIEFSTFYGGTHGEEVGGIAIDDAGNVFVGGMSSSWLSLPVLHSYRDRCDPFGDAFLLKYTSSGSLVFATLFGGDTDGRVNASDIGDHVNDVVANPDGSVYVLGTTFVANFPVVDPPAGMNVGTNTVDAFLVKFGAVDNDAPKTPPMIYSTRVGGSFIDEGYKLAAAPEGGVYVLGHTLSTDLPLIRPAQDHYAGGPSSGDLFIIKVSDVDPDADLFQFETATMSGKEGATLEVKVTRTGKLGGIATLNFASSDGTGKAGVDYQAVSGQLQWAATDSEPKTFDVKLLNDSTYSGDRTFDLVLSDLTGNTQHLSLGASARATVTIQEDESAPVPTDPPPSTTPPGTTPPGDSPPSTTPPPGSSPPPSTVVPGKKGGGGALDIGWSLLLGWMWLRRRSASRRRLEDTDDAGLEVRL
jgi:hypothetical protein